MSYCCDRSRSVTWGLFGGLPSYPHGAWLNPGKENEQFLGAIFSNVKVKEGDSFTRPSAGGGGLGDPLQRSPEAVLEDVIDGYVSIERAEKDYGVVIRELTETWINMRSIWRPPSGHVNISETTGKNG